MIARTLSLVLGLSGAAGLSQFPEFSQQYLQRLGGAVDALGQVVAEFDADAARLGLTREAALADLAQGGRMGAERSETMARTMARHARLSADLAALEGAGPFTRARLAAHLGDREIARRTAEAFKPAVPVTFEGAVFAGTGFVLGALIVGLARSLLAALSGVLPRRSRRRV